jgi:hypothetical protein
MFQENFAPAMSRFIPSPPEYDAAMHEGISPTLRRGHLACPAPRDALLLLPRDATAE